MKLYELKQIIKEEIYKELNEGIFSTTCTLDDLEKEIEEICKEKFKYSKYEVEKDDSENRIQVKVNYESYQSNNLTFIQRGQNDENIYKKLKERCNADFQRFVPPLSKFCTGILKINRPGITMYTGHRLPVNKVDEKTGKVKSYMYSVQASLYINADRGANYSESKEETNQPLSYDSVKSMPNVIYIAFFLRS